MPNTKSAERRMRNSQRKRLHNRSVKTKLRTLERQLPRRRHRRQERRSRQAPLPGVHSAL